jgi:radical SAM-linked protein
VYTNGFHPKPDMSFGPALSLGVMSLDEYADIRLAADLDDATLAELCETMTRESPAGLAFTGARKLERVDGVLATSIAGARYLIAFARMALSTGDVSAEEMLAARCADVMSQASIAFVRRIDGIGKTLDVRRYLTRAELAGPSAQAELDRAGLVGDLVVIEVECAIPSMGGGVKAVEVAAVIAGDGVTAPPHRSVRVELFGADADGRFSPLARGRGLKPVKVDTTGQTGRAPEEMNPV